MTLTFLGFLDADALHVTARTIILRIGELPASMTRAEGYLPTPLANGADR